MAQNNPWPAGEPWSIFTQGGGPGAAATWADDALREIGAPLKTDNEQFIYDWEVSEGGGGAYNPLNQGPDPNHPNYTSTGSQYGGGAANYTSWQTGLKGTKDYLNMPAYSSIRDDLRSDNPVQARTDLINSPWAGSHYGGGSGFSDAALPGKKSALSPAGGNVTNAQTTSFLSSLGGIGAVASDFGSADFWERAALIIFGGLLILVGIIILALPAGTKAVEMGAGVSRDVRAIQRLTGGGGDSSGNSGGPTPEEREDRQRRLALAEENTRIGAEKVRIQGLREERLNLNRGKHKSGREPNPNPAHS